MFWYENKCGLLSHLNFSVDFQTIINAIISTINSPVKYFFATTSNGSVLEFPSSLSSWVKNLRIIYKKNISSMKLVIQKIGS